MASVNINSFGRNNQKKNVSVATATIDAARLTIKEYGVAEDGKIAVDDVLTLFSLPAGCVITNAYFVVEKVPTATTAQIKIDSGTDNLVAATAVGSSVAVVGSFVGKAYTKSGTDVTATISTAALTDGIIEVVVEYTELHRVNGEYVN